MIIYVFYCFADPDSFFNPASTQTLARSAESCEATAKDVGFTVINSWHAYGFNLERLP